MSGTAKWNKSLRLNFSYSDDGIALISSKRIEIIPPPSDNIDNKSGFSVRLIDENGDVFTAA